MRRLPQRQQSALYSLRAPLASVSAGLLYASSWLLPGTVLASLAGFLAVQLMVLAYHFGISLRCLYVVGCIQYSLAMYWIPDSFEEFYNFGFLTYRLTFFLVYSFLSFQIVLVGVLFRLLPRVCETFAIRTALAWITVELWYPQMFPARVGHTQLAFTHFAQLASILGVYGISFLMFWMAEALYLSCRTKSISKAMVLPFLLFLGSLSYGVYLIESSNLTDLTPLRVAAVQVGPKTDDSHKSQQDKLNYLSRTLSPEIDLIVWPYGVLDSNVNEGVGHVKRNSELANFPQRVPLLLADQTFRRPTKIFKSSILIMPDGSIPTPYHKQKMFPFTEYLPLDYLPWPRIVRESVGKVTSGEKPIIYNIESIESVGTVSVGPLVCYDDTSPAISRRSVLNGAEILISISSGFWSKDKIPFMQHNLIAAFRSIEYQRAMLRVSANGYTAALDQFGRIISSVPLFRDGVLEAQLHPHKKISLYASFGDTPWYCISLLCIIVSSFSAVLAPWIKKRSCD